MIKTILLRGTIITLAAMAGICFVEGYVAVAVILWLVGAITLLIAFPAVESSSPFRKGRLLAYILPAVFFVAVSALVLLLQDELLPGFYLILAGVGLIYVLTGWMVLRIGRKQ